MAATFIGADSDPNSGDSQASSRSAIKPAGAQIAVFFINIWIGDGDTTITPATGATLRNNQVQSEVRTATYIKYVDGDSTGTTYTFSFSGSKWSALHALFFDGVDTGLTLSTVPFNSATANGTAYASTTVTTVTGAALAWNGNAGEGSGLTHTPPTNFTEASDLGWSTSAYRISPGDGSQTASGGAASSAVTDKVSSLLALAPSAGAGGQDITPAAETVSVTPGTLTVAPGAVDITPGAVTVQATPGTLSLAFNAALTAPTVAVTPGTVTITTGAVDITPEATTVSVTPGSLTVSTGAGGQDITPGAVTVTATPGTLTVAPGAVDITPGATTVTVTPGTVTVTSGGLALDAPTVGVTPGELTITTGPVDITPAAVTVTATPGTLALSLAVELDAPTVTVTPGTLAITPGAVNITPEPVTVSATPGSVVVVDTSGFRDITATATLTARWTGSLTNGATAAVPAARWSAVLEEN